MSAYGTIATPSQRSSPLEATLWPTKGKSTDKAQFLQIYHLTLETAKLLAGLIEYLHDVFAQEVEDGLTYPQESPYTIAAFEAYFFAADLILAIEGKSPMGLELVVQTESTKIDLPGAVDGRRWDECVAGFYYIKPNYPGRSSHVSSHADIVYLHPKSWLKQLCNAGFVVPPLKRGLGYGTVLAESYLYYGPKLGYEGSVFNLVYVNNEASIKMWERLGFTKAGLIPRAGRIKRRDGGEGEEYMDAWVFYKSFLDEGRQKD